MKHTAKEWFVTTRFWSFPVSAMPVLVTTMFLVWKGYTIAWICALLALVGNVVFHAAGNLLSDYWDYRKGVDNEKAYAIPQLVFHHFDPGEYLRFSAILFGAGAVIGIILTILSGWQLLIIGVIGVLLAASYSFFKFRALGDVFVFTCFGVLPVAGTSLVVTGMVHWSVLALSIPLGILTVAVLHDNNTVDIASDRESGIRTVPMLLGERLSVKVYLCYLVLPYLAVAVFCIFGALPWLALACLLSLPVMLGIVKQAAGYFKNGREAMLGLDRQTAKLHMTFSLLLAVGLILASIF